MDVFLNWTVNLSPIIVIIFYLIFGKLISNDSDNGAMIAWLIFCAFVGLLPGIISFGYGNIIIAVVMQFVFTTLLSFLLFCLIKFVPLIYKTGIVITISFYVIYSMLCLYERLKMEDILKIDFLDYIIDKFWNINFFELLIKIIENEWFKGIAIAAIGGIISGLVLKHSNKKGK